LAYTAPGSSPADRAREQAIRRLAEQLALLMEHERALRHELEQTIRASFASLLSIPSVGTLVAAGLIARTRHATPGLRSRPAGRPRWRHPWRPQARAQCVTASIGAATAASTRSSTGQTLVVTNE
jgi:plasmid stabilization system protein ParE